MKAIIKILNNFILILVLFFSYTLILSVNWAYDTFGNLTLEEIVFNMKVPLQGTNTDFYYDYADNVLPYTIGLTAGTFILLTLLLWKRKFKPTKAKRMKQSTDLVVYKRFKINVRYAIKLLVCIIILISSIIYATHKTNLVEYVNYQISNSHLIENEYVDPRQTQLSFPETKRNLIYIYLESMEATYYSKANGGAFDQSLIPELEQLAQENVAFSNSDTLKGAYSLPGTTWTTGAMVAQSTGLPLKIAIQGNSYGSYDTFLPGVYSIGQMLEEQGYNQMLMIGSDAAFGGRSNFFQQHGNYNIFETATAVYEGKIREDERVWWGYNDTKLFEYAKEKITLLSQEEKPFNFTMLTADTHHPDGYLCEECENQYEEQYFNVLACSSRQVVEFVRWIQEQDFYENTTIVICGDHPSMQPSTFDAIEESGYERTTLNIFINPAVTTEDMKNKGVSTLDMFPTTVAALGINIEGNKLGIGTNLFSEEQTIINKYGLENVIKELNKNSRYYNKQFIYEEK